MLSWNVFVFHQHSLDSSPSLPLLRPAEFSCIPSALSCFPSEGHARLHDISLWCHPETPGGQPLGCGSGSGRTAAGRLWGRAGGPRHKALQHTHTERRRKLTNSNNLIQTKLGFFWPLSLFVIDSLDRFMSCFSVLQPVMKYYCDNTDWGMYIWC